MYYLTTTTHFDAAHFLAGYQGGCRNIHGHRWNIEIRIQADALHKGGQLDGMHVDFSTLKKDVSEAADYFDHMFIVEEGTLKESTLSALEQEGFTLRLVPFRPTAENLAKYFFDTLTGMGYDIALATVYETPENCASYCEEPSSVSQNGGKS